MLQPHCERPSLGVTQWGQLDSLKSAQSDDSNYLAANRSAILYHCVLQFVDGFVAASLPRHECPAMQVRFRNISTGQ
jgi:hypothetical protein